MDTRTDVLQLLEKLLKSYTDNGWLPTVKALRGVLAAKIFTQVHSVTADEYLRIVRVAGLEPAQWVDEDNQELSAWIESHSKPLPFGGGGLPYAPLPRSLPWQRDLPKPPTRWQHMVAGLAFVALAGVALGLRFILLMPK